MLRDICEPSLLARESCFDLAARDCTAPGLSDAPAPETRELIWARQRTSLPPTFAPMRCGRYRMTRRIIPYVGWRWYRLPRRSAAHRRRFTSGCSRRIFGVRRAKGMAADEARRVRHTHVSRQTGSSDVSLRSQEGGSGDEQRAGSGHRAADRTAHGRHQPSGRKAIGRHALRSVR